MLFVLLWRNCVASLQICIGSHKNDTRSVTGGVQKLTQIMGHFKTAVAQKKFRDQGTCKAPFDSQYKTDYPLH